MWEVTGYPSLSEVSEDSWSCPVLLVSVLSQVHGELLHKRHLLGVPDCESVACIIAPQDKRDSVLAPQNTPQH